MKQSIIYTRTDEAPALATYSFLPVIQRFVHPVGIRVETRDISLAGRILAQFPELLTEEQRISDDLTELGALVKQPDANIIKLPNISASLPQLRAAIAELQEQGYPVPDYPDAPSSDAERDIRERYDRVKGSAVNPVLREGNSDRRAPNAVKEFARMFPHSMEPWQPDSKSHVASMTCGDYFETETSVTMNAATRVSIRLVAEDGTTTTLKDGLSLQEGEIVDAAVLSRRDLRACIAQEIADAKAQDILFSVHLKATMMKISDPIIFGHVVSVFFADVFEKHAEAFSRLGIHPNNGLGDLYARIEQLPLEEQQAIRDDIDACFAKGPAVSMVDSDRGITNFHVPSDFIIDATMPAAIRNGGKSWAPDGSARDTKYLIPDRSYARVYQVVMDDCRKHGAFDPATMGSVSNVGLMAQKAEEYGSHDKTFEVPATGVVEVLDESGERILSRPVETGDIFRMCQVKDAPVRDWVRLAVSRARATGAPAVFWLDSNRAHDAELIRKVEQYLPEHDTEGLEILVMPPAEATQFSVDRLRQGLDTVSVTGNVLRDYLTDLFPILEVGTSAKMLSIVPLMNGGGLFETGAGGSAPKHVQQMVKEGHLRWDSLGEFLALAVSLEHLAKTFDNTGAAMLAAALDTATAELLKNGKSPKRKAGELDNRGSHFYLALYWSVALSQQAGDKALKQAFAELAAKLSAAEDTICAELNAAQGKPVDLGGYYHPDDAKATAAMRPSATFNAIIDNL